MNAYHEAYDESEEALKQLNAQIREQKRIIRESLSENEVAIANIQLRSLNRHSSRVRRQMRDIDPQRYESEHAHHFKNAHHRSRNAFYFDGRNRAISIGSFDNDEDDPADEILTDEVKEDMQRFFNVLPPYRTAIFNAIFNQGLTVGQASDVVGVRYTAISKNISKTKRQLRIWIKERQLLRDCDKGAEFNWARYFSESICFTPKQKLVGTYLCTHKLQYAEDLFYIPQFGIRNYANINKTVSNIQNKLRIIGAAPYVQKSCSDWPVNMRLWGDLELPIQKDLNEITLSIILGRMLNGQSLVRDKQAGIDRNANS